MKLTLRKGKIVKFIRGRTDDSECSLNCQWFYCTNGEGFCSAFSDHADKSGALVYCNFWNDKINKLLVNLTPEEIKEVKNGNYKPIEKILNGVDS